MTLALQATGVTKRFLGVLRMITSIFPCKELKFTLSRAKMALANRCS